MPNEAVLVFALEPAIPFTVSNTTGIEKGALLKITDPMTASAVNTGATAAGSSDLMAGIAASEKITSDGKVKLGVYRRGIFKVTASGAVDAGRAVSSASGTAYLNTVMQAGITVSGAGIMGHSLETAADGHTFLIQLDVGAGGNQIS